MCGVCLGRSTPPTTTSSTYYITLHNVTSNLNIATFHSIPLHCHSTPPATTSSTHYIALHYIALHYITSHCIASHRIALCCIALHCAALHGITLPTARRQQPLPQHGHLARRRRAHAARRLASGESQMTRHIIGIIRRIDRPLTAQ